MNKGAGALDLGASLQRHPVFAAGMACVPGYYLGQVLMWLAGQKSLPKLTPFQLVNAAFVGLAGAFAVWYFSGARKPWVRLASTLGFILLVRHVGLGAWRATEARDGMSLGRMLTVPLADTVTFGAMAGCALCLGLYVYERCEARRS